MYAYKNHLILSDTSLEEALLVLDGLAPDAIVFIVDENEKLIGSLTDGDVRRGLIKGKKIENSILEYIEKNPKVLKKGSYAINDVIRLRDEDLKIVPVIDEFRRIVNVVNFRFHKSYLPVDAVIMAGGRGERLRPLTDSIPKPLLKVGDKPIIEHNLDRLATFGIDDFWISVRFLGEQLEYYFKDGSKKNLSIKYIRENEPLGTIGAVKKIKDFKHDFILVTNSDLLTNLDYEDFFLDFISRDGDFSVLSIPYKVEIPYAVLETNDGTIHSFKEKPTMTYYSNGGVYLMKRTVLKHIPDGKSFNATDLLQHLINIGDKVISYNSRGCYWLDIGKHEDYEKAQNDIAHIKF